MKTCLVVDDSSVIRKAARRILEGPYSRVYQLGDRTSDQKRKMP